MATAENAESQQVTPADAGPGPVALRLLRLKDVVWRLLVATVGSCLRYRVTASTSAASAVTTL